MEYVSPEGLRLDGRRDKELRKLNATISVLQSADGSATFEMGNTKVRAQHMSGCIPFPFQVQGFQLFAIVFFAGYGGCLWTEGSGAALPHGR